MSKEVKLVEIARSFAYKVNLGNYEMADFFCSQKAEVPKGKEEEVSEALYRFCRKEVMKSVADYQKETKEQKEIKEVVEPVKTGIDKTWEQRKFHSDLMQDDDKEDYQRTNK